MRYSARLMACAVAATMAVALIAGCSQPAAQEKPAAETSEPVLAPASQEPTSEAQPAQPSAPASENPTSADATPRISLGELNLLDVHEADGEVLADAVLQVRNAGDVPVVLGASELSIFGDDGTEIVKAAGNGVFTGPSYLRAGDVGFIYTSGPIALPDGWSAGQEYGLTGNAELTACKEVWEYPVSDVVLTEDAAGVPLLTGKVTNDDDELADLIEVTVVYLDNERNMLGVASDIVTNLEPGTSADFSIDGTLLPVGCTMAVIAGHDVIAVAPKF